MHVLHAPSMRHQLRSQPVQELLVLGRGPFVSKIKNARYKRLTEMPIPKVVDGHSGRKRISHVRDPLGQRRSSSRTRLGKLGFRIVRPGV